MIINSQLSGGSPKITGDVATPSTVLSGYKFVANSKEIQTGNLELIPTQQMGDKYNEFTLPQNGYWTSVVWGKDKFVAVAGGNINNTYVYSFDGISWVNGTFPTNAQWYSITYGDGKFVVITQNNSIVLCSNDGINWEQGNLPVSNAWNSVTYGGDKFVAVGGSLGAYSLDGIIWTRIQIPAPGNETYRSVTYGNDKFVAVVGGSSPSTGGSNLMAYSLDGIIWVQKNMPTTANWTSVVWGKDKFVAVSSTLNIGAYSLDGITWTQTAFSGNYTHSTVIYAHDKFYASTGLPNVVARNQISISEDGITWPSYITLPRNVIGQPFCFGNGTIVLLSNSSNFGYYSIALYRTNIDVYNLI